MNSISGIKNDERIRERIKNQIRKSMDMKYAENKWTALKSAIVDIQKKNSSGLSFEDFYHSAYSMVLNKHGEVIYNGLKEVVTQHLETKVREEVLSSLNNNFLHTLNQNWIDHQTCMVMIRDILVFMDRAYVRQNNLDNIYNLGLVLFRDTIVHHEQIRNNLRDSLLDMVMRERSGEIVDRLAIKNMCRMLVALGIDDRFVYLEDFEQPFLLQSAEFYRMESQKFLAEGNASVYIKKAEIRINEERERAKLYLDRSTEAKLVEVVENELIKKHLKTIVEMEVSGLVCMPKDQKAVDLACMYRLLSRVEEGLKTLEDYLSRCLREQGQALVQEEKGSDPIAFVQSLLGLKDRFDHFLINSFNSDKTFEKVIGSDFEFFLNLNSKCPEYLSLFITDTLKKGVKGISEQEIEKVLDKTIDLFKHLKAKDSFESWYRVHLSRRLLANKSAANDNELFMISKLKNACGYQYTRKLERMFTDMTVSNIIMDEFKEHVASNPLSLHGIDLSVRILAQGFWPVKFCDVAKVILPQAPREAFAVFKAFYLNKHSGRKLTLNPKLGSADLTAVFYGTRKVDEDDEAGSSTSLMTGSKLKGRRKHILQVSTYQMCILVLFNDKDELTFEEILQTEIPRQNVLSALQGLIVGKHNKRILTKTPDTPEIEPSDTFRVNDGFTSKSTDVKIPTVAVKGEAEAKRKETRDQVEAKRKFEIEAAIVRIMKARKTLSHNDLVAECTELLRSRFVPTLAKITEGIKSLIEREYLARMADDAQVYTYEA